MRFHIAKSLSKHASLQFKQNYHAFCLQFWLDFPCPSDGINFQLYALCLLDAWKFDNNLAQSAHNFKLVFLIGRTTLWQEFMIYHAFAIEENGKQNLHI